jgi:uncharacterized protein (DUF2237 family)
LTTGENVAVCKARFTDTGVAGVLRKILLSATTAQVMANSLQKALELYVLATSTRHSYKDRRSVSAPL